MREVPHVLSRGISRPPSGVRNPQTHQKAFGFAESRVDAHLVVTDVNPNAVAEGLCGVLNTRHFNVTFCGAPLNKTNGPVTTVFLQWIWWLFFTRKCQPCAVLH